MLLLKLIRLFDGEFVLLVELLCIKLLGDKELGEREIFGLCKDLLLVIGDLLLPGLFEFGCAPLSCWGLKRWNIECIIFGEFRLNT